MRIVTSLLLAGAGVLMIGLSAGAAKEWQSTARPYPATGSAPTAPSAHSAGRRYEWMRPCLGRGYVAYSYPAFGSCPCSSENCFHPGRYYCGGKPYRKQWFRKWLRAHVGRGSMLDDHACECRFPTAGRAYQRPVPTTPRESAVPPRPVPKAPPAQ